MRLFLLTLLSSVCFFKPQSRNFLDIFPFTFSDLTSFLNKSQLLQANCGHWCSFFGAVQCFRLSVAFYVLTGDDIDGEMTLLLCFLIILPHLIFFLFKNQKKMIFSPLNLECCAFFSWSGAKWWWRVFSTTISDISTVRRLSFFFPLALLWFRFWVFQMLVAGFAPSWSYFTAET